MQNKIKTSIIIPVYNVEEYLDECLQSVLAQTQKEIEIILVDDGSTDSSGIMCDNYARKDSRIIVIHQENKGLVSARKAGMRCAKGEYIYNLDSDDWIEPNMLESLLKVAEKTHADYVQSGLFYESNKSSKEMIFPEFIINNEDAKKMLFDLLSGKKLELSTSIVTKLYRKDVFCECYELVPDDMCHGEDFIMFLIALSKIESIAAISDCFYHYRIRNNSLSHLIDKIELVKREDKLTWYMYDLLYRLFPDIKNDVVEKWLLLRLKRAADFLQKEKEVYVMRYTYPNIKELIGKRIVIYGAGAVGKDYVTQLSRYETISIMLWVDQNYAEYDNPWRRIFPVEKINDCQYDYVIIAIKDKEMQEIVKKVLVNDFGVEESKIKM